MSNIKSVKPVGDLQTYDLEVEHPDHQFYLSNGVLTSNSHSTLYSMISYHTAYLKAHYPLEFLTACLKSEVNSNSKDANKNKAKYKSEIRSYNVNIIPPDVNKSELSYTIIDENTLLTGLDALKFMGKDAIPEIIKHRPYASFEELLSKVDGKLVKAPAIQGLAASGCLDSFGMTRKQMYLYASDYKKKLQLHLKKKGNVPFNYPWPEDSEDWTIAEKNALEVYYLGEGLSGTLFELYPTFFSKNCANFKKLSEIYPPNEDNKNIYMKQHDGSLEGIIRDIAEFKVKKEDSKIFGQTMARITLQDPFGNNINMTCFPDKLKTFYNRIREVSSGKIELKPGIVIHVAGSLSWFEDEMSIIFDDLVRCKDILPLPTDREHKKVSMRISKAEKEKRSEIDPIEVIDDIEDQLVEEGLEELYDFESYEKDGFN